MTWPLPTFSRMDATVVLDEVRRRPIARRAADVEDEVADELRAKRSVVHFGMELHGPDAALLVGDAGKGIRRDGSAVKARGQFEGLVPVAHPDRKSGRQACEQGGRAVFDGHFGVAVLALGRGAHLAAHVVHDEMKSIADAQHGHAKFQQLGIGGRGVRIVDRRRSAGQNDAERLQGLNFSKGNRAGQHDGEDVQFANAPRNQLRILRAKIENNNCLGVHSLVWQGPGRDVKN